MSKRKRPQWTWAQKGVKLCLIFRSIEEQCI